MSLASELHIFCIIYSFNRMNILMKNIVKINIYNNSKDDKSFEPILRCIDIICISFSSYKVRLVLEKEGLLNSCLLKTFVQEDSNCALVNDFSLFLHMGFLPEEGGLVHVVHRTIRQLHVILSRNGILFCAGPILPFSSIFPTLVIFFLKR